MTDPRPLPNESGATLEEIETGRPSVAATRPRGTPWLIGGGAAALGLLAFVALSAGRARQGSDTALPDAGTVAARDTIAAATPPPELDAAEWAARGAATPVQNLPPPVFTVAQASPPPETPAVIAPPNPNPLSRSPTLVVDFAENQASPGAAPATSPPVAAAAGAPSKTGGPPGPALNGDEQFASRVSAEEPERAQATQLHHRATLVAQGTTITGVLETALNSDLPGYTRAVVSRDVRGFDGSQVLIPRGSRVIGQYKSAVAQGQTRAFVIWTRVIRPDGGTIQIASSGTDPLGRAGLAGKVNTHFFERFSGAILLSVINAGVNSIGERNNSTQIVIGSSADASTASLAALVPTAIPPTIKVAQGTPIRIFVARDLDFSTIQASER